MNNLFNLSTFFKFLGKNKTYTFIDLFGLAVSLMFVILIAVYTVQELSTDKFHEKGDRIYVLGNQKDLENAYRIADRIQERYPEIEKVCPVIPFFSNSTVSIADAKLNVQLLFADAGFFNFFRFKLYEANSDQVMSAKNYAVISRTFARKAFGNTDPIGQMIAVNDSMTVTVNGIMDDIKNSTIPYCDIVLRIDNIKYFNSSMDSEYFENAGNAYIFLMEKEGANIQAKAGDMLAWFKEIYWIYYVEIHSAVTFTPLKEIYFSDIRGSQLQHGDWKFVMILMSVGLLILMFAVINYINLTVAQAGFRAKEMAARRLLGSSQREVFARLILESTLLCLIAFLLALLLVVPCVPYANTLLETKLYIADAITPSGIMISLGSIVVLGVISGWLPAMIISNVQPIEITKGSFGRRNKMVFSRFFIIFQNIITVMLLVASITMTAQTQHLIHAPLGYNTVNIVDIRTWNFDSKEQLSTFVNETKQLASVKQVALGAGTPFNGANYEISPLSNGKSVSSHVLMGDSAYFDMLGLQILQENHSSVANSRYLSQQALKETELSEDAPAVKFEGGSEIPIAGIIKDIQLGNITHSLSPVQFGYSTFEGENADNPWNILVEVQGDPMAAYNQVKAVYERITELDFNGKFIDQQVEESFAPQKRISTIVIIFTIIAILISLLGLIAMSTYFVRQRTKEIAIRKVHGAENFKVLSELVQVFLTYVLIAFVIAVPIIWYIIRQWLDDYAYRISLSPWIFIAAGLFCFLVAFISVYWQSRIAANANPVTALNGD
ncbi:ABC transporter, permease protein [Candidatus Symbiothrix dinenymphae]|nr:ABC transporter, permease protein [Candidatus Symbiothrix dinenymphae]